MNVCAAYLLAKKLGPGHTIVTVLCDGGGRYVSKLYSSAWLEENNLNEGLKAGLDDLSFLSRLEELNEEALTTDELLKK